MKTKAKIETETAEAEKVEVVEAVKAAEVTEALEAEAADSVPAPEISVDYDDSAYLRARTEIPAALDKKFPEYTHIWCPVDADRDFLNSKGFAEVKNPSGGLYRSGDDKLVRLPSKRFSGQRKYEQDQSLQSVSRLAKKGEEYRFNKKRSPKQPVGHEED